MCSTLGKPTFKYWQLIYIKMKLRSYTANRLVLSQNFNIIQHTLGSDSLDQQTDVHLHLIHKQKKD